jgi:hypothetical protein
MPKLSNKINPQIISSFVLLVITGALLLTCSFTLAWFSSNNHISANGMHISVTDKRISLSDTIEVTRTLGTNITTNVYRCEGEDSSYYLYENGSFATDDEGNRIPFIIANLISGETVDETFAYTCTDSLIGSSVSAALTNITSDTFTEIDIPDIKHSILGVYKFSSKQGDSYPEGEWVVNYTSGESESIPDSIPLFTNVPWSKVSDAKENNYTYVSFRFEFDLTQYNTLNTTTNMLSEKSFFIGELRIEVK